MTLNEAIKYLEQMIEIGETYEISTGLEEYCQLAEWLKELKAYREQSGDAISRQAVLDAIEQLDIPEDMCVFEILSHIELAIGTLPSVTPQQKVGRWIPVGYDGYADGNPVYDWWECSECGWEHTGDEESLTAFCPNCGAKMEAEK